MTPVVNRRVPEVEGKSERGTDEGSVVIKNEECLSNR